MNTKHEIGCIKFVAVCENKGVSHFDEAQDATQDKKENCMYDGNFIWTNCDALQDLSKT